jgi:hypothetical protein
MPCCLRISGAKITTSALPCDLDADRLLAVDIFERLDRACICSASASSASLPGLPLIACAANASFSIASASFSAISR